VAETAEKASSAVSADPEVVEAPRASIGEYMAQQRKLRGISLQELCERTKIPRRNIERLEAGALDDQPDGFSRGFVRTLAEALGLDADEAVMRLMREPEADDERIAQGERRARRYRVGASAAVLALVALLGVAVFEWVGSFEPSAPPPQVDRDVTYRSDVVRSLAREAPKAPVRERPAAPEPDVPPPVDP
jgi:cytoskeletal protein RodZ